MSQHGWTEKGYYTTIHDDGPVYRCADCGRLHGDAYAICQPCADKARAAHLAKFTVEESAAFEDQRATTTPTTTSTRTCTDRRHTDE